MNESYIRQAIDFAKEKNKFWPFAAFIVDNETGAIIVKAVDCAHISPVFHAESFAIHLLALNFDYTKFSSLSLYSTAECDMLGIATVLTARCTGYNIDRLVYGAPQKDVCEALGYKFIDISAYSSKLKLEGNILKNECITLYKDAKILQQEIGQPHPAKLYLSKDINDFCEIIK